ncbi:citrate lyase acyl carrier protein [Lacticaseibacillus chiayiensis]|uniref:Citrate lyase acyl carrier protein n=1 Tax=Lacticaseibacillus chiayiensis TaxID=2100821 RepID=A0A4Q1UGP3_9LACO|nr:citrate lyase acyl carrier protein [Lacticaseibacillus chiayiensis]QVI35774.1 citrate lyase acyl carrier protein [Lacticaseibacillus chiayiensis]RXT30265.1 citrate lyase acyl carrier protein [Lacticaseibacillus chiayiensis]RXT59180.1 citrate lyase acyl carrier protein [Lacticaseibacillus chiayiensis]UYN57611.1 citrate lyase acyl carrier protein [Lacticaseibacillus chiayiensis]
MGISKAALAGTLESSDIQITLSPAANGIQIELTSAVASQFGEQIKKVITQTLQSLGIDNVAVKAVDKGALDCVIKARTIAAGQRALGQKEPAWEVL